jgi:hypothetical protein
MLDSASVKLSQEALRWRIAAVVARCCHSSLERGRSVCVCAVSRAVKQAVG